MMQQKGVPTQTFAAVVVVLVVIAAIGFGLYLTKPTATETMTETTTSTTTQSGNATSAFQFTPAKGQMLHSAWVVVGRTESGQYTLAVYAQGLDTTQGTGNDYIVEGAQSSGSMAVVPVGANATASEFDVGSNGVGSYFTLLSQNPLTSFENIQIVFLPGMHMTNATVVATASLTMMSH
jgi:hypothetical protein